MREKITIHLTDEELEALYNDIKDTGLTAMQIARQFRPRLSSNYILAKIRGDAGFTKSQYAELRRIINGEKKRVYSR